MRRVILVLAIGIFAAVIYILMNSAPASAASTGVHFELTMDAVNREGFAVDSDALAWLQVTSFYADAYEIAGTDLTPDYSYYIIGWGETIDNMFHQNLRQSNYQLHFNGIGQGGGIPAATTQWDDLFNQTWTVVHNLSSDHEGDEEILLTALGVSLHKVQDFYSHSNWASLGFGDATWFDISIEDIAQAHDPGGGGLNGYGPWYNDVEKLQECDAYNIFTSSNGTIIGPHPMFGTMYREAFYASWQWVRLVRSWVEPALWQKAANYVDPSDIGPDVSWERDFWRDNCQYAGRWKGNCAGLDMYAILGASVNYVSKHTGGYQSGGWNIGERGGNPGRCMNRYYSVAPYVYSPRTPSVSADRSLIPLMPRQGWLTIDTINVGECYWAHNMQFDAIDVGGTPDFQAWITVNGRKYFEPEYIDRDAINSGGYFHPMAWYQMIPLDPSNYYVTIAYSLWDNDAPLGDAEHCSINGTNYDWTYTGFVVDLPLSGGLGYLHTEGQEGLNEDQAYVDLHFMFGVSKPVADADGPYYCAVGENLSLYGGDSYFFPEARALRIVKYEWDINNDGNYEIGTADSTYNYTCNADVLPGIVTLRVTDLLGETDRATTTITWFGAQLTLSPHSMDLIPGGTGTYDLTIENKGNGPDIFDLSLGGLPATWTYSFSSSKPAIAAFGTEVVHVYITPYKDWSTAPGDYSFTVNATSEQAALYWLVAMNSESANVHVLPFHEVAIGLTPLSVTVKPGQAAEYIINVTNLGNVQDSFGFTLLFDDFDGTYQAFPTSIQTAWARMEKGTLTTGPGQSELDKLIITAPQNWAGMEDATYKFTAKVYCLAESTASASVSANLVVKTTKQSMAEYVKLEIQWLQNKVISLNLKAGVKTCLLHTLSEATLTVNHAIQWIQQGDAAVANNLLQATDQILDAFINQVSAQKGKAIQPTDALVLIGQAQKIQNDIQQAFSNQ